MTITQEFRKMLSLTSVSILSASPVVATAYDRDFENNLAVFSEFANANKRATILLLLGFEHETPEMAEHLAAVIARFNDEAPNARAIVLCNCAGEISSLSALGVKTRLVHQNSFLDERRYRPFVSSARPYDAAYIARLTPCKRHELMPPELAPKLLLMGLGASVYDSERAYADMVRSRYAAAHVLPKFSGARISEYLAMAKCGLVLSAREGASFCSGEYFLCGLPVVDTPALGGRSTLYPEEYVRFVDATTEAVAAGIAYWCEHSPDPWKVRAAWLDKTAQHRAAYRELMRELTGRTPRRIPHKLGLRTPHSGALYSLAIQAYLFAKGMMA